MAQKLQNITIGAPGFKGVNTQDSPIGIDPQFAEKANNCVIDRFGRLGARKGYTLNTDAAQLTKINSVPIKRIAEWSRVGNPNVLVAAANNKLFFVEDDAATLDALTEITLPASYTITGDDWVMNDFNGKMYFHQAGHDPLVLTDTSYGSGAVVTVESESTDSVPVVLQSGVARAMFGRMWVAVGTTVYWSDTLIGENFSQLVADQPSFAGSLDLTLVWPDGYDVVNGLAAHNGKLIIMGEHSVVVYAGAEDPTTMVLEDSFAGEGCISPESVVSIGNDVLYLSNTGVRSLSRTTMSGDAQLPDSDVSNNIRQDLLDAVRNEQLLETAGDPAGITATYSPTEALYMLKFYSSGDVYAFDVRGRLEDGTFRVTTWFASPFYAMHNSQNNVIYVGGLFGVGVHTGYRDGVSSYQFSYESAILNFGDPATLKFIKSIRPTIIGGTGQTATVGWGYGYSGNFTSQTVSVAGGNSAQYNVSEYNTTAEYAGGTSVTDEKINANGSGRNVRLKVECDIDGEAFSLQEINVQALLGRIV